MKRTFSRLLESELEKAEVLLAAKAISTKLQGVAEDLAKIEASDLLPLGDSLKTSFGPQMADNFNQTTSNQLRNLLTAISTAKSEIDNQVVRMEGIVNGTSDDNGSDMAANGGMDAGAPPPENDMGMDAANPDDGSSTPPEGDGDDMFAPEDDGGHEGHGHGHEGHPSHHEDTDQPPMPPEGRARKESFGYLDKVILETFKKMMEKNVPPTRAANYLSEKHGVDLAEVVSIIKEGKASWGAEMKKKADDKKAKELREAAIEKGIDEKKPVIATGYKGMKSNEWRKKFPNMNAYKKWLDTDAAGNIEVKHVCNESVMFPFVESTQESKSKTTSAKSDINVLKGHGCKTEQQISHATKCLNDGCSHEEAAKKALKKYSPKKVDEAVEDKKESKFFVEYTDKSGKLKKVTVSASNKKDAEALVLNDDKKFHAGQIKKVIEVTNEKTEKSKPKNGKEDLVKDVDYKSKKNLKEYDNMPPPSGFQTMDERKKAFAMDMNFFTKPSKEDANQVSVYGEQSGFCYATGTEQQAKAVADKLFSIKKNPDQHVSIRKPE